MSVFKDEDGDFANDLSLIIFILKDDLSHPPKHPRYTKFFFF